LAGRSIGVDTALRLNAALHPFWTLRDHSAEGRGWLEQALTMAAEAGHGVPPAILTNALRAVGVIADRQGDYARTAALEDALAIYLTVGDKVRIASSHGNPGLVPNAKGDYERAEALEDKALRVYRELGDRRGVGSMLNNLAAWVGGRGMALAESLAYALARALRPAAREP
jgi:non-specific serine/threonine protein kinase